MNSSRKRAWEIRANNMHGADNMITYSGYDRRCFVYAIYNCFPDKTGMSYIMGDVRLDIYIYSCIHLVIQQMFIDLLVIKQYSMS